MKKYQKYLNISLITILACNPVSALAMQKSETIYSNLNYDGTSYQTTISNHLSWLEKGTIEDDSELKDILNISGNENFKQTNQKLSWISNGEDIYYQGTTTKELPIKTEIKYYLNEEEKEINDLLGKEGKIKIKIHFENKLKNIRTINGKNIEMYTPFVTTVGTMLDSKYNKNISITNGKVTGTGSRNFIVGLASPGLYQSMGLKELEKLDEIEINYETTNFSLNNIYIIATPKLLEEQDLSIFKKMDNLYNDMRELQENMNKLEAGAKELENGANSLNIGSTKILEGIKNAQTAIEELKKGTTSLDNGINSILSALSNSKNELTNSDLTNSLKNLSTLKNQNQSTINSLIQKSGMSENQLQTTYTQYNLKEYNQNDPSLLNVKTTYELILLLKTNNQAIDSTIKTMNQTNEKITQIINTLEKNLTSLSSGSKKINNGLSELKLGINTLYTGANYLNIGTKQLQNGANSLSQGTSEFNRQGIKKLNSYVSTLKNYNDKLEALQNLSDEYKGFVSSNSNDINFISIVKSAKITYKK